MAAYFGDPELAQRTEQVIAEELAEVQDQMAAYKARLNGKTAALFVGGSRSHHYQGLLQDLGIKTVLAGYEFGHRDDYEGREIIPNIKDDADSKNIEHITVEKDEKKYHAYLTQEQYDKLAAEIPLEKYHGMKQKGADILVGGVKERPLAYKLGIAFCDHNHERKHALGGFEGVENFTREVNLSINSPVWQFTRSSASFAEATQAQANLVSEALAARAAHF